MLAGALAFRLFTPLLPLVLLGMVILGYSSTKDPGSTGEVAHNLGIKESALDTIAHSSQLSGGSRIGVAAFALFTLFTASVSATRAIRAVHSLAWGMPLGRFSRTLGASLAFIGWMIVLVALWAAGAWARKDLGLDRPDRDDRAHRGLLRSVAGDLDDTSAPARSSVAGVRSRRDCSSRSGLEVIHLVTVLYLAHKAGQFSAAYGALGTALIVLLWLYLLSRLIVASAFLNATLWERATDSAANV